MPGPYRCWNKILLAVVANQERGNAMPKENDLDGQQDQGGKHGGQKGMPKPEPRPKTEIPGRDRADGDTPRPLPE
jgi:hypothetical protein